MKTRILNIILTVTLSFALLNVHAEGTKGEKSVKKSKIHSSRLVEKFDSSFDKELSLENWMTELKEFSMKDKFYEEELMFENWMMKDFNEESMVFESSLELEGWMKNAADFGNSFEEEELRLEAWMLKKL